MKLYLVRHAEPKSEYIDPEKHLSEKGIRDARNLGIKLLNEKITPKHIFHSELIRAKETALLISKELEIDQITEVENLCPTDSIRHWSEKIELFTDDIMLVGHMPYMSLMIEYLTTGEETHHFNAPEAACLERVENGYWSLCWVIKP